MQNHPVLQLRGLMQQASSSLIIKKKRNAKKPNTKPQKLIMEWIPRERRKRGHPRKMWMEEVQAAMTTRNLEPDQERGMVFGFQKTATAVKNGWMDGWMDGWVGGWVDGWMDGCQ